MWTRARGERAGNSDSSDSSDSPGSSNRLLLVLFLDFIFFDDLVVFQRQIELVDARVVFVAEARVFFDAEHASAEALLQWALGFAFLITALREVRSAASFRRFVRTEIPVVATAARLTVWTPIG